MGDLGVNSIWSNISNRASNVERDVLGPSYSYADNVRSPSSLGVGSDGSFGQLSTNLGAVGTYINTLIQGNPPLGNRYYVNTGGTCTAPDGSIQARYNYINNFPNGSDLLPAGMSDLGAGYNGLIPGVVGDIEGLNPLYMMKALAADSSPTCGCYECDVTTGGTRFRFLTPSLSPDVKSNVCREVGMENCPRAPPQKEGFCSSSPDAFVVPTLVAGIALCVLLLMKMK
jgi:hypothetical protein